MIEDGRIVEEGDVFSVLTRPQHSTTARFVEAVTGVELPAYLAGRIRAQGRPGDDTVLRITFTGENATAPVISRLSSTIGVDVQHPRRAHRRHRRQAFRQPAGLRADARA